MSFHREDSLFFGYLTILLQMQHSVLDLLGTTLVPELRADVAAGTAGNIHLALIGIAAVGADPNELTVLFLDLDLAVEAAFLAVVTLCVQLRVHDVVVNKLHHFQNCVYVLLQIGNFHIADGTARGELLEV